MNRYRLIPIVLALSAIFEFHVRAYTPQMPSGGNSLAFESEFDPFMHGTLESGPTTEVPWENDPDFLKAKEENGCPTLLAAYKTVLHDPLPGEESNVHTAADYVAGTVVEPDGIYSENRTAGPYTLERGYKTGPTYMGNSCTETIGGGVCKVASTLYNVVVLANLAIVERHEHSMPVPYVPYGQDATVCYGAKDFRFRNNTAGRILIWARGVDNVLYIAFYGQTAPPKIVWNHDVIEVYKAPVYYQKNRSLPKDTRRMTHEGMDGAVIRSWITLVYPDGTSEIRDMAGSRYQPLPYLIEISG